MNSCQATIAIALQKSVEAVTADNNNQYLKAVKLYEEALQLLESDSVLYSSNIRDEDKDKIADIVSFYSERLDTITRSCSSDVKTVPDWMFAEVEPEIEPETSVPTSPNERPYWLMRKLTQSMLNGAFLSGRLYMPRELWYQSGAKFIAIETKFNSIDTLLLWLLKLKELDFSDLNSLNKDIEEFCEQLVIIQNNLARKLQYIDEVTQQGQQKTFMNSISKQVERIAANYQKDKLTDSSEYVQLLLRVFETSQFLISWQLHLNSLPSTGTVSTILNNFAKIHEFMYNVLLAFVFQDLRMLLQRYMKKNRKEFF